MSLYEYRAAILRVVDGDTVHAAVDLGCDVTVRLTIRLYGINSPEMRTPEGPLARDYLTSLLATSTTVTIRTIKDKREKYGRYLAMLIRSDGLDLNQEMIRAGHAVAYLP